MPRREWPWIIATIIVILGLLLVNLDGYALLDPDEGRNAEVMREMAATNDYVLPHLNGLPYVDKPALYFAVGALGMEILGPTVCAARLPSLLFTVATFFVVGLFAVRLYGRHAAWVAIVATAATPFMLAYSRTVIFDSALTFWVVVSVMGFYEAVDGIRDEANGDRAIWWRAVAWGAMGLGVLTKGPIALALPLMIVLPFAAWRRRLRATIDGTAVLLFLALVLPWVFAVSREVPDFLQHVVVTETARRLTTTELGRTGPLWYFFAVLPAAALPWSVVAVAGWISTRSSRTQLDARTVFLWIWIAVPVIFFTISQSKRPQYVLPLMPAVALLVSSLWTDARDRLPGVRAAALVLCFLGAFLLVTRNTIATWVPASPDVASAIPGTAMALGLTCLIAGAAAWVGAKHRGIALLALSLPVAAIPFASTRLMAAIGRDRSAEQLALAIDATRDTPVTVVGVRTFPLSLPFYLQRTITLATANGAELTSNYLARDIDRWKRVPETTLRDEDWWKDAATTCSRPTVFVVRGTDRVSRAFLAGRLPLLIETHKHAAYGPCDVELLAAAPWTGTL